jgi:hypothetical protein
MLNHFHSGVRKLINDITNNKPGNIKNRRRYKSLYQAERTENQNLINHIKTATIRKDSARLIFKREKMRADFYSQDAKSVNRKILIIKNLLFEVKQYINNSNHGQLAKLSNIITSIEVMHEYIIRSDSSVTDLVENRLKRDIFDFVIAVVQKKINRLNIDEPYLAIQHDDFYEGAFYILTYIIKLRDEIEPDDPTPSEDTFDYSLNNLAEQIQQELSIQTVMLSTAP